MTYPRYFATMGIPIVQGRDFDERDLGPDSPLAVVVNQAFVREILDGQQPLGAQHGLTIGRGTNAQGIARREPLNIVGVVQDTRYPDLRKPPSPMMYQTFLQTRTGRGQMVLHARVTRYSDEVVRQVRGAVQAIDPDVPMFEIHTLAGEIGAALVRERLIATLSGFFGVVALVLVCVGLYGVMAFSVSRRTAEIGIRVALGATRADVRWLIARQTLLLVLLGISIGLPAAWAVGRLTSAQISGMLFELAPTDGLTMASATAVLVAVGLCAGLLPARRAMRIDPVVALRSE